LLSVFPLRAARKEPTAALIACADITRQKDAEREAHLANDRVAAILRSIKDAFVTIDRDLVYRYVNHAAAERMGLEVNEIVGRNVTEVSPNLRQSGLVERIERVIASGTADIFEQHDELNDVWFEYRAYPSEEGASVFYNDITERKRANETIMKQQEQLETAMLRLSESSVQIEQSRMDLEEANRHLQELAVTDGLTGLLNHRAMQDELIIATNKSATWGLPVSVALLDVDHFKKFNDAFGHQAGDQVLTQLAVHLRAAVREGDIVARYGGEEFCVIFPDTLAEDAAIVCERIRKQVQSSEWEHRKVTVSIGFSSGVGVKDQQELIRQADQALYQAKAAGRNCVVPFKGESTRCA
jgi:diguanylate cyclase (GGDEF)-like protein/PAS domain S-box-containing protein